MSGLCTTFEDKAAVFGVEPREIHTQQQNVLFSTSGRLQTAEQLDFTHTESNTKDGAKFYSV